MAVVLFSYIVFFPTFLFLSIYHHHRVRHQPRVTLGISRPPDSAAHPLALVGLSREQRVSGVEDDQSQRHGRRQRREMDRWCTEGEKEGELVRRSPGCCVDRVRRVSSPCRASEIGGKRLR